jgi:predicted transcriptional regulator
MYAIDELIECLPCRLTQLYKMADISYSAVNHIKAGGKTRKITTETLLCALSHIYSRPLHLGNVSGITIQDTKDKDKEQEQGSKVIEDKETYTLRELIENLPLSLREFGRKYNVSEVTIARLRDGKPGMRSTVNKMLLAFSEIYGKTFTMRNVRGILIRGEARSNE